MPDTGAPWNIPYVAGTDLVSDWPTDSQTLAEAVADGLDVAAGLVAVKHALFTGTQVEAGITVSASFDVTDLTITHTLADASNKLVIMAYLGAQANSEQLGGVGIAVADDGTPIGVGDAAGSRARVGAGGITSGSSGALVVGMPSVQFVYAPGDVLSHTYTVKAYNMSNATRTIYINRSENDADSGGRPRAASGLTLMEVRV